MTCYTRYQAPLRCLKTINSTRLGPCFEGLAGGRKLSSPTLIKCHMTLKSQQVYQVFTSILLGQVFRLGTSTPNSVINTSQICLHKVVQQTSQSGIHLTKQVAEKVSNFWKDLTQRLLIYQSDSGWFLFFLHSLHLRTLNNDTQFSTIKCILEDNS